MFRDCLARKRLYTCIYYTVFNHGRRCGIIGRRNENQVLPFSKADMVAKWFYNYYNTSISCKLHKLNHPYRTFFNWVESSIYARVHLKKFNYYSNKETRRRNCIIQIHDSLRDFHQDRKQARSVLILFSDSSLEKKKKGRKKYHGVNAPTLNAYPRKKIPCRRARVFTFHIFFYCAPMAP